MKKLLNLPNKVKLLAAISCAFLALALPIIPLLASSPNFESANVYLPAGQIEADIVFLAGANLDINSELKDDFYGAGANVVISGPIDGDVLVAGSNVIINSEIKGNLRVIGGVVTIKGKIAKNVTVFGGVVSLLPSAEIGQNLIVGAGQLEIGGKIGKNLYAGAGQLILNGLIGGNAKIQLGPEGQLSLLPSAIINGNLDYSASSLAEIQSGAQIFGQENFNKIEKVSRQPMPASGLKTFLLIFWLLMLLGTIVVGLVLIVFLKEFTQKTRKLIDKNIFMLILKGLAILFLTPIALILLALTGIGVPLAMILGAIFLIAIFISRIIVGLYLGEKIIRVFYKKPNLQLFWPLVVGLLVICGLGAIPFLGFFVRVIVILWGLGALGVLLNKELKLEK